jgi:hypothetical protein
MSQALSDFEIARIKAKFREALGRELTPEECKYLGLSNALIPVEKEKPNAKDDSN